jgi:uncharacterized protein
MNPKKIIRKYYKKNHLAYKILLKHSKLVKKKALKIAKSNKNLNLNIKFIKEASMLHDIGIIETYAPNIGCYGQKPYLLHGHLGSQILKKEGLLKHALICERHTGVGITKKEIIKKKLPLPKKEMVPKSHEEEIICLADKFFSKTPGKLDKEKSLDEIRKDLSKYGKDKVKKFNKLIEKYNLNFTK